MKKKTEEAYQDNEKTSPHAFQAAGKVCKRFRRVLEKPKKKNVSLKKKTPCGGGKNKITIARGTGYPTRDRIRLRWIGNTGRGDTVSWEQAWGARLRKTGHSRSKSPPGNLHALHEKGGGK